MDRTVLRAAGDVALALLLLALVGFAPLARVAADAQPVAPPPAVAREVPRETGGPAAGGPDVRDLPAGLPSGPTAEEPADLRALADEALGAAGGAELVALLEDDSFEGRLNETAVRDGTGSAAYPYRYPAVDRLLDDAPDAGRTAAAGALGAALVPLALLPGPDSPPNAAPAAYAVLDRARARGDCGAQLNLLLLVAADAQPRDQPVAREAERARIACPSDPTPLWLEGQYLSQRAATGSHGPGDDVAPSTQRRAEELFAGLVEEYGSSAGAWAGYADDRLRFALRATDSQPFTARRAFEDALVAYRRADRLKGTGDAEPGQARALLGLGEPGPARDLLATTVDRSRPAVRLQVLLEAEEQAHEFGAAEEVARRLDSLGPAGFEPDGPVFPVPGGATQTREPVGTDRLTPLVGVDLQPSPEAGGNGALVVDGSFVPVFRGEDGIVGTEVDCPEWAWRRDAVLAGRADAALQDWPTGAALWFEGIRPEHSCPLVWPLEEVARAEAGERLSLDADSSEDLADRRQNLWRWAGDLDRAAEVVEAWSDDAGDDAPAPVQRLGEVRYLQERYDDAAALFGRAARLFRAEEWNNDLAVWETQLQRGAALLRAGRRAEATPLLRSLDEDAARGASYQASEDNEDSSARFAMVAYHSRALLADSAQDAGELPAAVEHYQAAAELVPALLDAGATDFRPERVHNNAAVALAALDRGEEALASARRAVAADPESPVFLFTASVAADRAGEDEAAVDYAADAVASDPEAFPAANDLGVRLAREGRYDEAVAALRRAVGAAPGYALGWFNLGVVQGERGPVHLAAAQGSLARAFALDPDLADRERVPTADETTYQTELDLSRPLPPRWSFARLQQVAPAASAGLLAVVLLGVGLARSTGRGGPDLAAQWLEPATRRLERSPLLRRMRRPLWAVAATVVVFTLPALRQPAPEPAALVAALVAGAVGVLVMTAAAVRARALLARRRRVGAIQESWTPGIVFGLVTSAFGAPWAPLPVVRGRAAGEGSPGPAPGDDSAGPASGDDSAGPASASTGPPARSVHAAAPVTLGVLAAVLFVEAAWFDVPLTHAWAVAALIMTASTLLPVEPLDGARTGKGGVVGSIGVMGAALLVALGLL